MGNPPVTSGFPSQRANDANPMKKAQRGAVVTRSFFSIITHNRHPIAHPRERFMGGFSRWVQTLNTWDPISLCTLEAYNKDLSLSSSFIIIVIIVIVVVVGVVFIIIIIIITIIIIIIVLLLSSLSPLSLSLLLLLSLYYHYHHYCYYFYHHYYILPQSLLCFTQYYVILDRVITTSDCISFHGACVGRWAINHYNSDDQVWNGTNLA